MTRMRWLTTIATLAIAGQAGFAQRGERSLVIAPPPQAPMRAHHFLPAPVFLGGAWYPGYSTDVVQVPPQVIVLQAPAPAASVAKEEAKPIMPLLIEWQNGRYVRSDEPRSPTQKSVLATSGKAVPGVKRPVAIVPAILIFRDGHREQVRQYTVADGAIYARGDYWVDGYWNKRIQLSALDVPATLSANQGSAANFELPSAPNVVIIGP